MPIVTFTVQRGLSVADKSRLSEAMLEAQVAAGRLAVDELTTTPGGGGVPHKLQDGAKACAHSAHQRNWYILNRGDGRCRL